MAVTYTPITTTTLTTATSTVTFSSIPSTYTDLVLAFFPIHSVSGSNMQMQLNSDTGSNYSNTFLYGTGTVAGSSRASTQTRIGLDYSVSTTSANVTTGSIMNYSNTTTYKTYVGRYNDASAQTTATVALWRNTSAVSSITLLMNDSSNFSIGSSFTLYGIKAA